MFETYQIVTSDQNFKNLIQIRFKSTKRWVKQLDIHHEIEMNDLNKSSAISKLTDETGRYKIDYFDLSWIKTKNSY